MIGKILLGVLIAATLVMTAVLVVSIDIEVQRDKNAQ